MCLKRLGAFLCLKVIKVSLFQKIICALTVLYFCFVIFSYFTLISELKGKCSSKKEFEGSYCTHGFMLCNKAENTEPVLVAFVVQSPPT
jgi:hypothetical protein